MSGFYDRAGATAMRMLEKFGRPWKWSSTDDNGAVTDSSFVACFIETVKHVLGDSGIAIGDRKYIATPSSAPKIGDRMTSGPESYVIVWSDQIGDTPCAYWIWGRQG
jgi:hypothetical protein